MDMIETSSFEISSELIDYWINSKFCTNEEKNILKNHKKKIMAISNLKIEGISWNSLREFQNQLNLFTDKISNALMEGKHFDILKQILNQVDVANNMILKKNEIKTYLLNEENNFFLKYLIEFSDFKNEDLIADIIDSINNLQV